MLDKFRAHAASHVNLSFEPQPRTGLGKLLHHVSSTCVSLVEELLAYDPDDR